MKLNKNIPIFPPLIFNVFKPARMSSYDVVRHFKRNLPQGFGKIGHFGTLDPFACGTLMIGIGGAARLNDFIHEYLPKTYLAVGKLGIETPTGDYTSEISQKDESLYLNREIANFPKAFINERVKEKFIGDYWQPPHKYSAAKFMGKNLHEWAREGVEVKKEAVLRKVYAVEVVKYQFPYLVVRVTVSSGTYVRTLFSDIAQDLGTLGSLVSLVRESVGHVKASEGIYKKNWPHERGIEILKRGKRVDDVLHFPKNILDPEQVRAFKNGAFLRPFGEGEYVWILDEKDTLLGLAHKVSEHELRPKINFHSEALTQLSSDHDPQ